MIIVIIQVIVYEELSARHCLSVHMYILLRNCVIELSNAK